MDLETLNMRQPLLVNMVTAGKLGLKSGEGFYDYTEGPKNKKVAVQFTNNDIYLKKESTKLMLQQLLLTKYMFY